MSGTVVKKIVIKLDIKPKSGIMLLADPSATT